MVCKYGVILGKSRHSGLWEDFGGARDESSNERPYDTAVRELTEESGLKPGDLDFGQRDPIIVSHAGHVHAVFVACMRDASCQGAHGVQGAAFVVAPSGRVQSTAATDGELSEFVCLQSFDDYFAAELETVSSFIAEDQRRARHGNWRRPSIEAFRWRRARMRTAAVANTRSVRSG